MPPTWMRDANGAVAAHLEQAAHAPHAGESARNDADDDPSPRSAAAIRTGYPVWAAPPMTAAGSKAASAARMNLRGAAAYHPGLRSRSRLIA
jgi:hypothetical protein